MNNSGLTYDIYTHDTLAVHGDKKMYHKLIKSIGGRWSSRLKIGGPGWIVPRDKQGELDEIIMSYKFSSMQKNAKSRVDQKRYHRSVSGGKHPEEIPLTEEKPVVVEEKPIVIEEKQEEKPKRKPKQEEEKTLEEIFQKDEIDPRILNHYKKYSKSPSPSPIKKRKKKYYVESSSSSEDEYSSSESDFPSFELKNKKKKTKKEMKKVTEQMEYLKRKMHKLQRKLQ